MQAALHQSSASEFTLCNATVRHHQWVGQTPNLCCRFSITAQNLQTTLSGFPERNLFFILELFSFYGISLSEESFGFSTNSVGDE